LKIADAVISSPGYRRMNERRMAPFVISSIFFVSSDRFLVIVVQLGTDFSCSSLESHATMYGDP
jgi:hypothetical protein